jgi:septum formation protein
MKIILASKSPRRTEILSLMNVDHIIIPSTEEEIIEPGLTPEEVVKSLAYQKARSISKTHPFDLVIGSDTIVVINNKILGKPKDYNDAVRMIKLLQNNTHQVMTGVSLIQNNNIDTFVDIAEVTFKEMTQEDIDTYLNLDKPFDKAGAYGIQDSHANFVKEIKGDYYTIMGLPKDKLSQHLTKFIK